MSEHPNRKKTKMAVVNQIAMLNQIRANQNSERGASMVEYAFLVILIAIIALVGVRIAGEQVSVAFSTVASGLANTN